MKGIRFALALAVGAAAASLSWRAQTYMTGAPGGDLLVAMRMAHDLLAGRDPYAYTFGPYWVPYPLPAAFFALPFSLLEPALGAALFFGLSSGLLAYGLSCAGRARLFAFLAAPFWFALVWAQWSPLIMAASFFPVLLPVLLVKPHIAAPVAFTRWSQAGIIACAAVALLSLAVYPTWPLVWLRHVGDYRSFFPLWTLPGPLLLLALLRRKDPDAVFLLLASLFPQRYFYDAFTLWLIPKTRMEVLAMSLCSWGAVAWKMRREQMGVQMEMGEIGAVSVVCFFLPALCVILARPKALPSRPE